MVPRGKSRVAAVVAFFAAVVAAPGCRPEEPVSREKGASPLAAPSVSSNSWDTGDPALDALQARLWPLLDANRRAFTGRTGAVQGFAAGETYPQIWLRDSATLLPLSRFCEGRPLIESWLVEHLAYQRETGALFDWIAPGEPSTFPYAPRARVVYRAGPLVVTADKNTTETDQESSAVLAASIAFASIGDPSWLRREVAGRTLLERLDDALAYVRRERSDPQTGLVVTALTADWGDVSPAHRDQGAIYLDEATPRVGSLYASALFHGAARALARLHAAAGDADGAGHWRAEADAVHHAVIRELWREKDGFFRLHAELPDTGWHPADQDMFALGGNAMALLHGLADETRSAQILAAAESRHRRYGLKTLAGTLLPPYPTGFFKHPILTEAWTYQNGGLWDWFAGRFLLGLFERGHSQAAMRHLLEIARRVETSAGLYEWIDRDGRGRGSPHYAGSGAALAQATIAGLFGIDAEAEGVRLSVRLAARSGRVRAVEPASGRVTAYEYRADLPRHRLCLRVLAPPTLLALEVLLPEGFEATDIYLGPSAVSFAPHDLGRDRYVTLRGPVPAGEVSVVLRPLPSTRTSLAGRPHSSRALVREGKPESRP